MDDNQVNMPLFFSHRKKLAELYDKWRKANNVLDCPFSVITFLVIEGLIDGEKALVLIKESKNYSGKEN